MKTKRLPTVLLWALLLAALLPAAALAWDEPEEYTVTLMPNLEGLEPIVLRSSEQGEIPYRDDEFDSEFTRGDTEGLFYRYSEEHPRMCFRFLGTMFPYEWYNYCYDLKEVIRFDGWDAQDDIVLTSTDTVINARWTVQRESAAEYELTPHAVRLQPGLTRVDVELSYAEADRRVFDANENRMRIVQSYCFRFTEGELHSDDGRTIPFYVDRDENGERQLYYRDYHEALQDADDYVSGFGIELYVDPADCEAAGSGTFRGWLRYEEALNDDMDPVGWNSIPVTLTLHEGAPTLEAYTVRLTPGEGTGEPLTFSSADQADIPTGYGSAGNCEFYYEEGSGELRFRLDEDWCPETFTAPQGWSFCCWEQPDWVELAQAETEVAVRWHVRRERPEASFELTPGVIELKGAETTVELVTSELVLGDVIGGGDDHHRAGALLICFETPELDLGGRRIGLEVQSEDFREIGGRWSLLFDHRGDMNIFTLRIDPSELMGLAPGTYTGELPYTYNWFQADQRERMRETISFEEEWLSIPLTLTVTTPGGYPPPQPQPSSGDGADGSETSVRVRTSALDAFGDLDKSAGYAEAMKWALENGVMNGVGSGLFDPNGAATRAMTVTALWRLAGEPVCAPAPFEDVAPDAWYAPAVAWAWANGVVNGVDAAHFDPGAAVTREQAAAILYRLAQSEGRGFVGMWMFPLDYPDAGEISGWADEAMHWLVMNGVIEGGTASWPPKPPSRAPRWRSC